MSQQINLFNPVFLKQEKLFSAKAMAQALVLMGGGLVLLFVISNVRIADTRAQAKVVDAGRDNARAQLVQVIEKIKPVARNATLDADILQLEARVAANRAVLGFLQKGDFGDRAPYSDVLRAFARQSMNGVWLTGFVLMDGANGTEIRGRAVQPTLVPAYIKALSSDGAFKGKSFSSVMLRAPVAEAHALPAKGSAASNLAALEFLLSSGEAARDTMDMPGAQKK